MQLVHGHFHDSPNAVFVNVLHCEAGDPEILQDDSLRCQRDGEGPGVRAHWIALWSPVGAHRIALWSQIRIAAREFKTTIPSHEEADSPVEWWRACKTSHTNDHQHQHPEVRCIRFVADVRGACFPSTPTPDTFARPVAAARRQLNENILLGSPITVAPANPANYWNIGASIEERSNSPTGPCNSSHLTRHAVYVAALRDVGGVYVGMCVHPYHACIRPGMKDACHSTCSPQRSSSWSMFCHSSSGFCGIHAPAPML